MSRPGLLRSDVTSHVLIDDGNRPASNELSATLAIIVDNSILKSFIIEVGSTSSGDVFICAILINFNTLASDTGANDEMVIWISLEGHGLNGTISNVRLTVIVSPMPLSFSKKNLPMFLARMSLSRPSLFP